MPAIRVSPSGCTSFPDAWGNIWDINYMLTALTNSRFIDEQGIYHGHSKIYLLLKHYFSNFFSLELLGYPWLYYKFLSPFKMPFSFSRHGAKVGQPTPVLNKHSILPYGLTKKKEKFIRRRGGFPKYPNQIRTGTPLSNKRGKKKKTIIKKSKQVSHLRVTSPAVLEPHTAHPRRSATTPPPPFRTPARWPCAAASGRPGYTR